jgi:tRNA A-37 threonylcarbamoyl transferase component Bud32
MFEAADVVLPESIEASERSFFQKLKKLPEEIAEKWEDRFYELEEVDQSFFDEFDAFMEKRSAAFSGVTEVIPGLNDEIVSEINEAEKVIGQTYGDPNYFLGNGAVAKVYELPIAPHVCVKYVYDNEKYSEGNHIRVEYSYLEELSEHSAAGVRTPKPLFIRIHPSEGHSYGMEKINGKSLSAILERKAENVELIELLKKMDRVSVKKQLLQYIESLHQQFKMTHGDLFLRNIMVDHAGNFYIIDFGKAQVEQVGEDHEGRRKRDLATISSEIGLFFNEIDSIDL